MSGRGWGQVIGGAASGLFDYTVEKRGIGPSGKSGYQLGVDIGIGSVSGLIGVGINSSVLGLSSAWQNGGGFLNQMAGDGFNTVLYPDYD
ncbi:MAG: hypothetical protein HWD62_02765 [Cyclobacteriaceae bacterium]|nr:MAG: hypothetical protein HWD62_02765 [Cyclobacteriaceae bacterium]